jgi:hypothetical protein
MTALVLSPVTTSRATPRCRYQFQDSEQTLAEGLAEYYALNRGRVLPPEELASESAALFRSHDICHVIFGLDTTLFDEAMADTRTMLSCDVGWSRYARYLATNPDAKVVFKEVGHATVLWGTFRTAPRLLRALIESFRMSKRWPWIPPAEYHARTLRDLRREYGIRVV